MKKIIYLVIAVMFTNACALNADPYDGAQVYSTVYPITYLIDKMYGEYSTINSIYPVDSDISDYTLTEKQILNYADSGDMFVYLGLTGERNIALNFVNENKKILLVDATIGLSINNSVEELWLSPNNYLMLTKNIRDNLFEALDNQLILETVDTNYNLLTEELSIMDAGLRTLGNIAINNGNNTVVVTNDAFLYLENYGFNVVSIDNVDDLGYEFRSAIENNFENERYLALIRDTDSDNELAERIIAEYEVSSIDVGTFYSSNNEVDYIEAMNDFLISLEILIKN